MTYLNNKKMFSESKKNVVISSLWRWHAYQLVSELAKWCNPKHYTADFNRPYENARQYVERPTFPSRLMAKFFARLPYPACNEFFRHYFDSWVARKCENHNRTNPVSIVHAWSSFALLTIHTIQKVGSAKIILERSGTHIDKQIQIIKEESERWGITEPAHLQISNIRRDRMLEEYELADRILTCSSIAQNSFISRGFSSNKIESILLGSNFKNEQITRLVTGKFTILSIGISSVRKGHHYLLEAWKRCNLTNAELIIVTDPGPFFRGYESVKNVQYLQHMPWSKLRFYYQQADVFCLASVEDGFGMVVSEAMALELPVIVSDAVGASDLVRDRLDGLIFPSRNIEALQKCIEYMYSNRKHARDMGKSAGEHVKQYTWDRYGKEIKKLYSGLL